MEATFLTRTRVRASKRQGFTLIELIAVIIVLILGSVMIVPSLLSMKATSDHRDAMSAVRIAADDTRERAIQNGSSMQLAYDESSHELQIQQVGQDDANPTVVERFKLPDDMDPQRFQLAGKDSNASDFKLEFGSDGRTVGGGIEFRDFAISVDTGGHSRYIEGTLPLPDDERWEAGGLEQRA
jgi:prepilin-type N-terminal cleavage/methylation domain-containing protein